METILITQNPIPFSKYLQLSLRFSLRAQPLLILTLVPFSVGLLAVWNVLTGEISLMDAFQEAPLGVLMTAFFALFPLQIVWGTWRQYKKSQFLQETVEYALAPEEIRVRSASTHTDIAWPTMMVAHHFGSWILLQTTAQTAFFLDLGCIQAPAKPAEVIGLLQHVQVAVK